ncbi:MAG: glycine--tRNA ligase [Oscillospiraceae bacterium]|nr:glycine--tRNA ligase [Oscillospiraceae bacterium]MCL2278423.1 glycine--tRNA ligase [Oscillospiraceae bacterium]
MLSNTEKTMDKITALCKGRGFVFSGSEIYGGLANSWDYGPLGVELKNNVKRAWWQKFVQENPYNVGLDSSILLNSKVWEASGHVVSFNDPLVDCKACKMRHRADTLLELCDVNPVGWTNEQMSEYIRDNKIACPHCGKSDFTPIRKFNMMFKTFQGVTEDSSTELYLRPETAQGIFINFKNVQRATRRKIPFGIAQIGKSFRNEITPGNFIFRTREFEQMEMEFFCKPGTEIEWFDYWRQFCYDWLLSLGLTEKHLRLRDHDKEELSHYSNATTDFEYLFPFGWGELWGLASRTDFDLGAHTKSSGEQMEYFDQEKNERYIPYVIEPALGVERMLLAFLIDAYDEEVVDAEKNDIRTVLRLHPALAPYKCAVLPLSKKLTPEAEKIYISLRKRFMVDFDDSGSIGKRYRRQDEIGTPLCLTYDFDSQTDGCVTVRDRDSMAQERIAIADLDSYLSEKLVY